MVHGFELVLGKLKVFEEEGRAQAEAVYEESLQWLASAVAGVRAQAITKRNIQASADGVGDLRQVRGNSKANAEQNIRPPKRGRPRRQALDTVAEEPEGNFDAIAGQAAVSSGAAEAANSEGLDARPPPRMAKDVNPPGSDDVRSDASPKPEGGEEAGRQTKRPARGRRGRPVAAARSGRVTRSRKAAETRCADDGPVGFPSPPPVRKLKSKPKKKASPVSQPDAEEEHSLMDSGAPERLGQAASLHEPPDVEPRTGQAAAEPQPVSPVATGRNSCSSNVSAAQEAHPDSPAVRPEDVHDAKQTRADAAEGSAALSSPATVADAVVASVEVQGLVDPTRPATPEEAPAAPQISPGPPIEGPVGASRSGASAPAASPAARSPAKAAQPLDAASEPALLQRDSVDGGGARAPVSSLRLSRGSSMPPASECAVSDSEPAAVDGHTRRSSRSMGRQGGVFFDDSLTNSQYLSPTQRLHWEGHTILDSEEDGRGGSAASLQAEVPPLASPPDAGVAEPVMAPTPRPLRSPSLRPAAADTPPRNAATPAPTASLLALSAAVPLPQEPAAVPASVAGPSELQQGRESGSGSNVEGAAGEQRTAAPASDSAAEEDQTVKGAVKSATANLVTTFRSLVPAKLIMQRQGQPPGAKRDLEVGAIKAAEAARKRDAMREAEKQRQKELLRKQKGERAQQFKAKQDEAQRRAAEEARRREDTLNRREEEAAARRKAREESERREREERQKRIDGMKAKRKLEAFQSKENQAAVPRKKPESQKENSRPEEQHAQDARAHSMSSQGMQVKETGAEPIRHGLARAMHSTQSDATCQASGQPARAAVPLSHSAAANPQRKQDTAPETIDIAPYRSDDDSDSDGKENRQPRPRWAQERPLRAHILEQKRERLDPDAIFQQHAKTCSLDEVFSSHSSVRDSKRDLNRRTSTGHWFEDRVTWREEMNYKKAMGYL